MTAPIPGEPPGVGDPAVPDSDAWWAHRLTGHLVERRKRIRPLWGRYQGDPPLPELGSPAATQTRARVWKAFQRKARMNLSELIIRSIAERLTPLGARVERDTDGNAGPSSGPGAAALAGRPTGSRSSAAQRGDDALNATARRIWRANRMDLQAGELIEKMLVMGEAYTLTGWPDPTAATGARSMPVITVEDPRTTITEQDPARPYIDIAGIKLYADPIREVDVLVLHRPGRAVRMERRHGVSGSRTRASLGVDSDRFRFDPRQWQVTDRTDLSRWIGDRLAISRFSNHGAVGEFEAELDHLDRIDHMILQRIIVATLQAFKQRAIKGVPTVDPRTGREIDYSDIFTADPGALWLLPATAELWESGQVDLTPLLSAVRDDVRDLAAVLRLPVYHFMPDAASGSAEGASAAREGLVYRAEDRQVRCDAGFAETMALAFAYLGTDTTTTGTAGAAVDEAGAVDGRRADAGDPLLIETVWAPIERFSLAERYSAAAQANGILPWESIMVDVLQYEPDDLPRLRAQRAEDQLMLPATGGEGTTRSAYTSGTGAGQPSSAGQSGAGSRGAQNGAQGGARPAGTSGSSGANGSTGSSGTG